MNISDMTRDQLRKIAAERNVKGRGRMTKAQLVEALTEEPAMMTDFATGKLVPVLEDGADYSEYLGEPEQDEAPELSKLAAFGVTSDTHNIMKIVTIIREWSAKGVDVLSWGEVRDFILVRNQA